VQHSNLFKETKELYGFIITSKIRHGIIKVLYKKSHLLQTDIAKRMKKQQQDISKEMRKLEKEGLVECLTPQKGSYKAYSITKCGKEAITYQI